MKSALSRKWVQSGVPFFWFTVAVTGKGLGTPQGFLDGLEGRESTCRAGGPLEKGTATHSSILAWRIPRIGEPGGAAVRESQRVGQD